MERVRIKDIAKMADVSVGNRRPCDSRRSGVSESSRKRVEEILKQLDYQPNMYASALASNKKYAFACLLPLHEKGEYWTDVETGIHNAVETYSDFNGWPCTSPTMTRMTIIHSRKPPDRFWHWSRTE